MGSWTTAENDTFLAPSLARIYAVEYPNRVTAYVTLSIGLILLLYIFNRAEAQKLAPGVWVVGGNDKQNIRTNRERFREHAKEMLEEGYRKVRGRKEISAAVQKADQG